MRIVWGYLKCRCWPLLLLGACTGVFAWVLTLYQLPAEAAGYGGLLCLIILLTAGLMDFFRWRRKVLFLESLRGQAALLISLVPEPGDLGEAAYRELLLELDATDDGLRAGRPDAGERGLLYHVGASDQDPDLRHAADPPGG